MNSQLTDEFHYYLDHQAEFVALYNGKVIVIKDDRVLGVYDDEVQAVEATQGTEELGTFLVQRVAPGDSEYHQTFHSRVAFA